MTRAPRWAERWAPIPGAPACYEVSDLGRVRSWWAYGRGQSEPRAPRVLTPSRNDCGYLKLHLGPRQHYVHRLVVLSFVGAPPAAPDECWTVDHIDFDLGNNRLDNLRWLTLEENSARHSQDELAEWWGRQHHRRRGDGLLVEEPAA